MIDLDWQKMNGLIPAIIQHAITGQVLMLGYMSEESLKQTMDTGDVTFYSRSKKRLWVKGETSGNTLKMISIESDCDGDTVLILAQPKGPTCHTGDSRCFKGERSFSMAMMTTLETVITQRLSSQDTDSYCVKFAEQGVKRAAQKVGEEGVEVALAVMSQDKEELISESADLLFHLVLLLQIQSVNLSDVMAKLGSRREYR